MRKPGYRGGSFFLSTIVALSLLGATAGLPGGAGASIVQPAGRNGNSAST